MDIKSLVIGAVAGAAVVAGAWFWSGTGAQHDMAAVDAGAAPAVHGAHAGHAAPDNPAVQAYMQANDRMHTDMAITFSGDADVDFAAGMIPHHQGAVDMARVVLEHGKDAEIRKLAQEIIAAQEAEITFFRGWLQRQGR